MAKRPRVPPPPPQSSSSEEDSSSEEEEVQEVDNIVNQSTNPKPSKSNAGSKESSNVDEESESSKEEDEEEESESTEEEEEETEKEEEVIAAEPVTKRVKGESSRSDPNQVGGKRGKIWTPEDEILLLNVIVGFQSETERLPAIKEYDGILSSLDGKFSFPATSKQVVNKLRKLKGIYIDRNAEPFQNLSNTHDKIVFDLSNKLWGDKLKDVVGGGSKDAFPFLLEAIEKVREWQHSSGSCQRYENAFEAMKVEMARYFEKKFKKLQDSEDLLFSKRMEMQGKVLRELSKL